MQRVRKSSSPLISALADTEEETKRISYKTRSREGGEV
jgi:hypothetical protein